MAEQLTFAHLVAAPPTARRRRAPAPSRPRGRAEAAPATSVTSAAATTTGRTAPPRRGPGADGSPGYRLDERTRALGLQGVEDARRALAAAVRHLDAAA